MIRFDYQYSCEIHMRIYHWQSCCSDSFKISYTKSRRRSYKTIKIHIIIVIRKWIIFWNLIFHETIWISVILRVWYLWLIEFAGLMTLFYIDLQSSSTNHSLYLDRLSADILWFNITNLRRWYIYIYDRFDQVVTLDIFFFEEFIRNWFSNSLIHFDFYSTSLNRDLFSKLYSCILMIKYNIRTWRVIPDDIVIESRIQFKSYLNIDLNYYWKYNFYITLVYCSLSQVFFLRERISK